MVVSENGSSEARLKKRLRRKLLNIELRWSVTSRGKLQRVVEILVLM
ncbi:hypothetical protein Patl1_32086 [Pistacia atlantica]|uniref:Uncharacterized protein n=1 Tax=Pistacia atlantica TaxID=434234 RepID=A0ACC1ARU4_9ROSI|nr:hypothetical protein Patl1_32086 [Pistacia atlantica]